MDKSKIFFIRLFFICLSLVIVLTKTAIYTLSLYKFYLVILLFALAGLLFFKKIYLSKKDFFVFIFFISSIIVSLFNDFSITASYNKIIFTFVLIIAYLFLCFYKTEEIKKNMSYFFISISLMIFLFSFFQIMQEIKLYSINIFSIPIDAYFQNHNVFARIALINSLFFFAYYFFYKKNKIFFLFGLINFLLIVLSKSRGGIISFIFIFALILLLSKINKKIKTGLFTFAVLIILLFSFNKIKTVFSDKYETNKQRLELAYLSIDIIKDNILIGTGLNNFSIAYDNYSDFEKWQKHPHNIFLIVLTETGIIVFFIFCICMFFIFKEGVLSFFKRKDIFLFLILGLFLHEQVDTMLWIFPIAMIFLILIKNNFQEKEYVLLLNKKVILLIFIFFQIFIVYQKIAAYNFCVLTKNAIIKKDYFKALSEIENSIKKDKQNCVYYAVKASIFYKIKQYDKAIMFYQKAFALSRKDGFYPLNISKLYYEKYIQSKSNIDLKKSKEYFLMNIKLDKKAYFSDRGYIAEKLGFNKYSYTLKQEYFNKIKSGYSLTLENLEKQIKQNPKNFYLYPGYCSKLIERGKYKEAIRNAKFAFSIKQHPMEMQMILYRILLKSYDKIKDTTNYNKIKKQMEHIKNNFINPHWTLNYLLYEVDVLYDDGVI